MTVPHPDTTMPDPDAKWGPTTTLEHIPCPVCHFGWVFQDSRGGYECSECDQRFAIEREPWNGYGGPRGPLGWWHAPVLREPGLWFLLASFSTVLWKCS